MRSFSSRRCSRSISASATAGTDRVSAITEVFASGNLGSEATENIMQEMWEKWVFLATLAASTSLMRASIGNILAATGGKDFLLGMLDECSAIAKASEAPRRPARSSSAPAAC